LKNREKKRGRETIKVTIELHSKQDRDGMLELYSDISNVQGDTSGE
jgi:hypothetical protein